MAKKIAPKTTRKKTTAAKIVKKPAIHKAAPKLTRAVKPIDKKPSTVHVVTEVPGWFQTMRRPALLRQMYVVLSLLTLVVTTIFWSILGARLQNGNADQLSDPYLFTNSATFHGATFPGAHTFLLKWPIFWLINVFGLSAHSIVVATVLVVMLTVGCLVWMLHKIERRPVVFATVCLALALALLLIPTQPYAGGVLPVSMAMLTTRNIEYIFYIASLVLFIRGRTLRSWHFGLGVMLQSILIASDKLFLSISIVGALLALVAYAISQSWSYVSLAVRWFIGAIAGVIGSSVLIGLITSWHITHIANGTSPYQLVSGFKDLATGLVYAVMGIFTNLGANPAYDATIAHDIPHAVVQRIFSVSGPAYIASFLVAIYGLYLLIRVAATSMRKAQGKSEPADAVQLASMLLWTSVAALGVFIATTHYYAVDSRYLTISLFAVAIGATTYLRSRTFRNPTLYIVGTVLFLGIILATISNHKTYHTQSGALQPISQRDAFIGQALARHHVSVLAGDYWRVLPAKLISQNKLSVMPFAGCTQPLQVLSSLAWQQNLHTHSFAYLLSYDRSLTNYPHCNLDQVVAAYGRPNASLVVSGNIEHPNDILLFYDHGIHKTTANNPQPIAGPPATVVPTTLDALSGTNCSVPTIMTVVAHQDDDILFTSPDLLHDVQAGHCIRTIFLTAGDGGGNKFYWINRQLGSEAAYGSMLGKDETWVQRIVRLSGGQYITVASPRDNPTVSLIFFNLPDGNLHGEGFASSKYESLEKLQLGHIKTIQAVDGESSYSSAQLVSALSDIMNVYAPAEIRTQADQTAGTPFPDHSDHIATGDFTVSAAHDYDQTQFEGQVTIPVTRYIGYPIHNFPQNVSGDDLQKKEAAFLAYAKYDGGVCHTAIDCRNTPTYGAYLSRQYQEK